MAGSDEATQQRIARNHNRNRHKYKGGLFAVSKISKSVVKSFSRLRDNNTNRAALQGAFIDSYGALCACDGFMMARLYGGADLPIMADVPRAAADPLHARLLDMLQHAANSGAKFAASAARAEYHGSAPVLAAQELRAFSRWSVKNHGGDVYPVGGSFVSAARLALMLDIIPDACIYTPASPVEPLYLSGADGDGLLLPVRVQDPKAARARLDEYKASTATPAPVPEAPAPAANPAQPAAPAADFVPVSIRDAVENTPETSVKVIGYKSDGNTVCVHRVQVHHVADNVYVYATKTNEYGRFMWQFVSVFACGYALKLDALQDSEHAKERPDSNYNRVMFHYCANFADDGADYTLVDYVRMHNACFADDASFLALIEKEMAAGRHVSMAFVRMLAEMGGNADLIARVMDYRQQRERALQKAQEEREKERLEQEKREEQQRQQQHAQALADCRAVLLSDGERMPVDGAVLCELAASVGVPASLKLKGWIMHKLATVTIEDGRMVMYQYNRQKKTEKGSAAFWTFMHKLLEALHQQEEACTQPVQQPSTPEEASSDDLQHLFGRDNTPTLENQPANLENGHQQDAHVCAPSDALQRLAALSSGTLSTLMREKGLPDCEKYKAIDAFHQRILFVAQSIAPVPDETWQQLFERAYLVAYASPEALDHADPVPACHPASVPDTASTQESTQDAPIECNTPALQNQATIPATPILHDGHTLPHTFKRTCQLSMFGVTNTS